MNRQIQPQPIRELARLIEGFDFAMLTTVDTDGSLRSRPMNARLAAFDGDLWFITTNATGEATEIMRQSRVNVSYAQPSKRRYVSVSGHAWLIDDPARLAELWSADYEADYPDGKGDPSLRLIRVRVDAAEYWDGHCNSSSRL
jgi:general stress protein 26